MHLLNTRTAGHPHRCGANPCSLSVNAARALNPPYFLPTPPYYLSPPHNSHPTTRPRNPPRTPTLLQGGLLGIGWGCGFRVGLMNAGLLCRIRMRCVRVGVDMVVAGLHSGCGVRSHGTISNSVGNELRILLGRSAPGQLQS